MVSFAGVQTGSGSHGRVQDFINQAQLQSAGGGNERAGAVRAVHQAGDSVRIQAAGRIDGCQLLINGIHALRCGAGLIGIALAQESPGMMDKDGAVVIDGNMLTGQRDNGRNAGGHAADLNIDLGAAEIVVDGQALYHVSAGAVQDNGDLRGWIICADRIHGITDGREIDFSPVGVRINNTGKIDIFHLVSFSAGAD